ncbi:MAG: N-acetyl-gamma-glutamyl-phosphate reductase [Hyphomicrobiales bacterium]|nr:N-acetyl-gamma-glutamyl-phosphate reductase [Hyphomicrobiales bacterium]
MAARIFIDGEAGTTGLVIRDMLRNRDDIGIVSIDPDKRKDAQAKADIMASVDVVVLCLPDEAAKESAALAASLGANAPKVLDASTAHRIDPDWTFGFPELCQGQGERIAVARRVANPGCYATGAIALLRPLTDRGLLPLDFPITINAVSGYSGGGRSMVEAYEARTAPDFELYALGLEHKHLPEIVRYSGMTRRPLFVPSVGDFRQGMLVSVPLHLDLLPGQPAGSDLEDAFREHYQPGATGGGFVRVIDSDALLHEGGKLEPQSLNDTNFMELRVYCNAARGHAVLVARLDNLGKGASGAAVQNLDLMLGAGN